MWNAVFFWCKTHLGFSRKEARGFLLLIPFLLALGSSPRVLRYFKNREAETVYSHYIKALDSLERMGVVLVSSPLPTFNPQDTVRRSYSAQVAERIQRLPFSEADSVTLQIVPGIGAFTAGRIIKHRERLGGFLQVKQLEEVFGLKPETIPVIWEYFDFDVVVPRRIRINQATLQELGSHPYMSYQEAKVVLAYRLQHGPYSKAEDLLRIKIFKAEWVEKIAPYLRFELAEEKAPEK
jgi:DNA uptake protein ComE-like DNA-binding protein